MMRPFVTRFSVKTGRLARRSISSVPVRSFPHNRLFSAALLTAGVIGSSLYFVNADESTKEELEKKRKEVEESTPLIFSKDNKLGDVAQQHRMERLVRRIQQDVMDQVSQIEKENGGSGVYRVDPHERGITMVLQDGKAFQKAGIAISVINGKMDIGKARHMLADHMLGQQAFTEEELRSNLPYFVAGVSCVIHPLNPHAPSVHFNYRYFELHRADGSHTWWYGGGADLTPTYVVDEEAVHFHQTLKDACDLTDEKLYPKYKKECDEYFRNLHRGESRGVGGIFFDGISNRPKGEIYKFIRNCADAFIPSYFPLVRKHVKDPYTEEQYIWQQLRRGRYAEFNLVYDRGTKFGLMSTQGVARPESVLMSLPLTCRFEYSHEPAAGTPEAATLEVLRKPKDWIKIPEK